jgi:hypothetical protein
VIDKHFNSVKRVTCSSTTSYPTKVNLAVSVAHSDNDGNTIVITSNRLCIEHHDAHHAFGMLVRPSLAIADTCATSIFLTKGAPCQNKQRAGNPITTKLPDGCKIKSTHISHIVIPRLPRILTGHIMPDMTTALLFGIHIICKAGCKVLFGDDKCQVIYNSKVILTGYKDPISDLWTLPILPSEPTRTTPDAQHLLPLLGPCMSDTLQELANFSYHRISTENNVKFMHQSLCNPLKSSLLKAIRQGFLRGAPHLKGENVAKYLPLSMAASKGHMKRPRKGICPTTPKQPCIQVMASVLDPSMPALLNPTISTPTTTFPIRPNITTSSTTTMTNPTPKCSASAHLQTKSLVSSTTTAPANSPTCPLMATFVFS